MHLFDIKFALINVSWRCYLNCHPSNNRPTIHASCGFALVLPEQIYGGFKGYILRGYYLKK